ncbi:hypothetical protein [Parasitella parasitica]|uniref:Uncharacterized protein n=1 Tax=Parasitella parasitica TaxID=35722 RepID=A0A0B7NQX7_9FUNG|nr:hypothetical protein [Parasitella parasitica]
MNSLVKVQERLKTLHFQVALHVNTTGVLITNQQLKTQTYQKFTEPAKRFKEALSRSPDPEILSATFASEEGTYLRTIEHLHPLSTSYPRNYRFQNDSIYYDLFSFETIMDTSLREELVTKFPGAMFVMGDYSAPNVRFQEPIRGKGFRRLLKKSGLRVFLIDENETNKTCPQSPDGTLKSFKSVRNLTPHRSTHTSYSYMSWCTNQSHMNHDLAAGATHRFFNRDSAACLSMIIILKSVRNGTGVLAKYQRVQRQQSAPALQQPHQLIAASTLNTIIYARGNKTCRYVLYVYKFQL